MNNAFEKEIFGIITKSSPISMKYDGNTMKPSFRISEKYDDGNRIVIKKIAETPDRKVRITLEIDLYKEAVEWRTILENTSLEYSLRFSEIRYCDISLRYPLYDGSLYPRIAYSRGSDADDDDFHFESHRMNLKSSYKIGSQTGRSSDVGYLPYVNLSLAPDRGAIIASGFSGSWEGKFTKARDNDGKAAICEELSFQNADFQLYPGETVRLPAALILPWKLENEGLEADGANVLFRRFIYKNMFPKVNGKPAEAPICLRCWGGYDMNIHRARLENVKKHGLEADIYGIDAGWYHDDGSWFDKVGDWKVSEKLYPNGLSELSELCADAGLGFSAWMEHERVGCSSSVFRSETFPLIRSGNWALWNLGKEESRKHMFGKICDLINSTNMKVFRTDFNVPPIDAFTNADEADERNRYIHRRGLTEMNYYQGLYSLLDALREKYPSLIIDNCAAGGRRLDYEMGRRAFPIMCRSDYFCAQSDFGENGMQNMTLCLSRWLPVFADSLGTCAQSGRTINVGDTYRARSARASGISLACPDFALTDEEAEWYRKILSDAKKVRQFMCRDFYPLTGASFSEKDVSAFQAHDPDIDSGLVAAFRRSECAVTEIELLPHSISAEKMYELEDIDTGKIGVFSGSELERMKVSLPHVRCARILFYRPAVI